MTAEPAPVVDVRRVACGTAYTRVSSIGAQGERAFVLVAGIGVAATYFERLAPQLNEFGAVHALDLPGFGGVPHPESAMSIAQYADAVEAVLDELALDDPVLVGHSMGTQVVSEVARRRPQISTLVVIGPVVDPEARRLLPLALRFLRSTWHEPLKIKLLAVGAYLLCGPRWFLRVLPEMMRFPIEELFTDIRAHTLVIRGEHDAVVTRAWVERVAHEIPFASTWEIGGAAHSVMHGHAEGVARLCVAFARMPRDTDGDLNLLSDAEAETPEPRAASVSTALRAFAARFRELIGVLRRDDREVARGKTAHARVMKEEEQGGERD